MIAKPKRINYILHILGILTHIYKNHFILILVSRTALKGKAS